MIKPKFFGKADKGVFAFNPGEREMAERHISRYKDGRELEMTIGPRYKRRTQGATGEDTNFNGYYWHIIVRIVADEMGELDQEYVHNLIQIETGNFKESRTGAKVPAGTSNMSGGEFSEYCQRARMWASTPGNITQGGIMIPLPNEAEWE